MLYMPAGATLITDGSVDFSGGVDSLKVTTIASATNPNGLSRNQLAWLINGTLRDGAISPRDGWNFQGIIRDGYALFQGAFIFQPKNGGTPYIIALINGILWQVYADFTQAPRNLTATFDPNGSLGLANPSSQPKAFFCQAEQFLVIQAGDNQTLPLFWIDDPVQGQLLRRSNGITGNAVPNTPGINEIPPATMMVYYMGRLWYAQNRIVSAGDIVGGQAGTVPYDLNDSVLKVTENPLALGGDGFSVPTNSGDITSLCYQTSINAAQGQGLLTIGAGQDIYQLQVPVNRADWIAAGSNNQPLLTLVQTGGGIGSDRSVVSWSGDIFFQSIEPAVRSLITALRYFGQWQNPPLSANEDRILDLVDTSLIPFASGILSDNRLLELTLPNQTEQGVVHPAMLPLDFTPLSTFESQLPPSWEGHWEGLPILQLVQGNYNGVVRTFAIAVGQAEAPTQALALQGNPGEGQVNVPYSYEFGATGGTPGYTWTVTQGGVPGLTLTGNTLAGTPSTAGTFPTTIQLTDQAGDVVAQTFNVLIISPPTVVLSGNPSNWQTGIPYSTTFTASGGVAPYQFSITNGNVPGLALGLNTGVLAGTPTTPGDYFITVQAVDVFGNLSQPITYPIDITQTTIVIISNPPVGVVQESGYTYTFTATGQLGCVVWTCLDPADLPPGLIFNNGVLSGTPTQAGKYTFIVEATDGTNVVKQSATVIVTQTSIVTNVLTPPVYGQSYSANLIANGGTTPYTFKVYAATGQTGLPQGISLTGNSIQGTAKQVGTFTFTVSCTDANGVVSAPEAFSWTIANPLTVAYVQSTPSSGAPQYIQPYIGYTSVTKGIGPYVYALTSGSTLPSGVTLNASTGEISGPVDSAGTFTFAVMVTDQGSYNNLVTATSPTQSFTVSGSIDITNWPPPLPAYAVPFNFPLAATGVGAKTWTVTASNTVSHLGLPPGITMTSDGLLSGTPEWPGTWTGTITVTDSNNQSASRSFTWTITPHITIPSGGPPGGVEGIHMSFTFTAAGGIGTYTFTKGAGSNDYDLVLNSSGLYQGIPPIPGPYTVVVDVQDSGAGGGGTTSQTFQFNVSQ
jgi:hypothetical protein